MRYIVQALISGNQDNRGACPGCGWGSWRSLWGDSFLSDMIHASYNTYKTVWYHIHIYISILGPLNHWWGTLSRLFLLKASLISEHVLGVDEGHAVVCGVIHPCPIWYIPHISLLIKQWDRISIHISSSLDHYTTGEVHCPCPFFLLKTGVIIEHVRGPGSGV